MRSGRYVLYERIGIGGMAEVFRAVAEGAEGFERPVAIKRILPSLSVDEDFVRMFVDEAKIAVQLVHPNIVQIFDLGRMGEDGVAHYFIAMELVHGKDLRAMQDELRERGERLPLAVVCHVVMKTCAALAHAHAATAPGGGLLGVVHRDVSPQNILLSYDGEVKVTDFGLAKAAGRAVQTQAGMVKGKLAYMSPEQLTAGVRIDHRSDIYAAGIVLWEMLTGRRLFLGVNDVDTVTKAQAGVVPRPSTLAPGIPPEIEDIVMRALARDRDQRYVSADEMHDDLEAFAYGTQTFLTSNGLGAWVRERFPIAPPPEPTARGAAPPVPVITREIRLEDIGAVAAPDSAEEEIAAAGPDEERDTMKPPTPDFFDDTTGRLSIRAARELAAASIPGAPVPNLGSDWADATAAGLPSILAEAPLVSEAFDDTTGKMMPAVREVVTDVRYDGEVAVRTVELKGPGWDDEETTDVTVGAPSKA